jgi:D-alanyl-D-alanine dipeptidase
VRLVRAAALAALVAAEPAASVLLARPIPSAEKPAESEPIPRETRQLLLATSAGWEATRALVQAYERESDRGPWTRVGPPLDASLGRAGLGWGRGLHAPVARAPLKREGDGRSPAGVFDLRLATGYEASAPAGVRLPYRQATSTLRCVDDPRSRFYNQLVDESAAARDWASAEDMRRKDALYRWVVWVGHNDAPVEPGGGSCIFLHLRTAPRSVTAGCTAFEKEPLERLLRWLDPSARPVLVQLPESEGRTLADTWKLP